MSTQQNNRRLQIAFLTIQDAHDKRSWSSTLYCVGRALQQYCGDVTYLGPLSPFEPPFLNKARAKSSLTLLKRRYLHEFGPDAARQWGREATQKLRGQAFDVIIALGSEAAVAYLETDIPIVMARDSTFTLLEDYYPYYTHISRRSSHEMRLLEQRVFAKVQASLFSSDWAARSAIEDYKADPQTVYVLPHGANLDPIPYREISHERKPTGRCKLLFLGVEWQRKGGDIAYETLLKLEEMDFEAELIICGCIPPVDKTHPRMSVIPYLDKSDPQQYQQLLQLYATADFLLLPTRGEAYGNVLCEASAFGLPLITTDTGGISTIVSNAENGFMLPFEAGGSEYASLIAAIYRDEQLYLRLARSSRAIFEERLNWDVWSRSLHNILLKEIGKAITVSTRTYSESR